MTPQQRHEQAIEVIKRLERHGMHLEDSPTYKHWLRENDEAVAAFYGLTVEQLETNIQVCWR